MSEQVEQRAFLADGSEVVVIERIATGVVIRRILEYGDGETEVNDQLEVVPQVFPSAPTERKAQEIREFEARGERLYQTLAELGRKVQERERAEKALQQFAGMNEAMARLSDFLAGRVTHYASFSEYGTLELITALPGGGLPYKENGYSQARDTRLITLFGKSGKNLQWRVSRYSDGSGNEWSDIEPFTCREDALARCQQIVNEWRTSCANEYRYAALRDSAVKIEGVSIPVELDAWCAERKVAEAIAVAEKARKDLVAADAKLCAILQERDRITGAANPDGSK